MASQGISQISRFSGQSIVGTNNHFKYFEEYSLVEKRDIRFRDLRSLYHSCYIMLYVLDLVNVKIRLCSKANIYSKSAVAVKYPVETKLVWQI